MPLRTLKRGDTFIFDITVKNQVTGLPLNITGWTLRFTVKQSKALEQRRASIYATTGVEGGLIITNAPGGAARVTVPAADTALLRAGRYVYDVEVTDTFGVVSTIEDGQLVVDPDVTNP